MKLLDKKGNSLSLQTLYVDESIEEDSDVLKYTGSVCFIESYQEKKDGEGELTLRYENGLKRKISFKDGNNLSKKLRHIGRDNGEINFDDIRSYALSPERQKELMVGYRTTSLDEILKANLSAQAPEMGEYVIDSTLGFDDPARYGLRPKPSSEEGDIPF